MRSFELNLFADYFQFYIRDEAAKGDLSEAWSEEATDRLLAVGPGTVGIGTVRNMDVPVTMEILEHAPEDDFSEWDHVVEAGLDAASGRIAIAGCTDYLPDRSRDLAGPDFLRGTRYTFRRRPERRRSLQATALACHLDRRSHSEAAIGCQLNLDSETLDGDA